MNARLLERTWAGFAVKAEGHAGVAGKWSYTGRVWRLAAPERSWCDFNCKGYTLGAGLGGGASLHLMFFLNCGNVGAMEDFEFGNGWQLQLNVPVSRLGGIAESLRSTYMLFKNSNEFYELIKNAEEIYKNITSTKKSVVSISAGDVALSAGLVRYLGGRINIVGVHGAIGYTLTPDIN